MKRLKIDINFHADIQKQNLMEIKRKIKLKHLKINENVLQYRLLIKISDANDGIEKNVS